MFHSKILPRQMMGARLLPLIIAVNVYLASLAITGGLALIASTGQWSNEIEQLVTVQVPPEAGVSGDAVVKSVLGVLREHPSVAKARPLELSEMEALLSPWLGRNSAIKELPLPQLIDVELRQGGEIDSLRKRLEAEFPGVEIDDHRQWRGQMLALANTSRLLCFTITSMILLAAISVIVFATRASLESQGDLVALLHMIGAHNRFVAGEFQKYFLRLGLMGAVLGLMLLALSLVAINILIGDNPAPWLMRISFGPVDYALTALPLLSAALITMLTARFTVLRTLAAMD
ncbi:MAG: cell division protein FtsX [Pseudomonadota bacterium]|jgi:cell division transport system permease protein